MTVACGIPSFAAMMLPVPIPAGGIAIPNHGAGNVAGLRRRTERSGPVAAGAAGRSAQHGRPFHQDMPRCARACLFPHESDEVIARRARIGERAWVAGSARSVHLPSRDARQANMRPLRAPDRAVAVIDSRRRAVERFAGRYDEDGKQEREHHALRLACSIDSCSPSGVSFHAAARQAAAVSGD